MSDTPQLSLYRRLTSSVPIAVSVLLHAVVILIAGYFLVTETIIGKKKTFEEAPQNANNFQKLVEHRLQVARKAGGAAPSPVSAQRIVSTAQDALQLPDMPELPQVGASSLSSMGFGVGMGTVGAGSGYNTGLGGNGTGAGFMTMSFLGVTNPRVSKMVFAVDISLDLMDIKKGGFQAFTIIRDEIMRLVSTLPVAAEFDVVLFERGSVRLFSDQLSPGTVENKTKFFDWMKHVNSSMDALGVRSATGSVPWQKITPANMGIDPDYRPGYWVNAVHAALQLKPEVIYLITGSTGNGWFEISDAEFKKRQDAYEKADKEWVESLKRRHMDPDEVVKARNAALSKARADLTTINKKQEAAGKSPFVIADIQRIVDADFQAAVRRVDGSFKVDLTGWSTTDSKPMWNRAWPPSKLSNAGLEDAQKYISRLQSAFLRQTAILNIFYFVGPEYKPGAASEGLTKTARRYNGKFEVLTTERLKILQKEADQAASK